MNTAKKIYLNDSPIVFKNKLDSLLRTLCKISVQGRTVSPFAVLNSLRKEDPSNDIPMSLLKDLIKKLSKKTKIYFAYIPEYKKVLYTNVVLADQPRAYHNYIFSSLVYVALNSKVRFHPVITARTPITLQAFNARRYSI